MGPALTLQHSFDPRRNSLNFLRLVLAAAVIFAHGITLGGYGNEIIMGKTTLGTVAVYGFFGISGYLIAGSASHNGTGRYLWQRFLRIFPAFWICLLVTAFGFGLIAWLHNAHHGSIGSYLSEPGGPLGYVGHNFWLRTDQSGIAGTLHGVPFFPVWNGSLWTLYFEFGCYLLLGALALVGLLRHRWAVALIAVVIWILEVVVISVPTLNAQFNYLHHIDASRLLILVPVFLVGSLLFLYRDVIPDSGWLAVGSTILFLTGLVLPLGNSVPPYTLTSLDFTAVFLAYPLLWLGIHLPLHKVGVRNDYSYGLYIYAWPVQQLLSLWGIYRWGYVPYTSLALLGTAALAVASWWLVEKQALSLKKMSLPGRSTVPAAETAR